MPAIFSELGGEERPWHPFDEELLNSIEYPDERPLNKRDEWQRPDLEDYTDEIGKSIEDYLSERYDMELVDDREVDLVVDSGPYANTDVQAKGAIFLASQGQDRDGRWYSRPGGIYLREDGFKQLDDDSLLHSVVHLPRFEWSRDIPVPVLEINDGIKKEKVETALVGELVLPVNQVQKEISFNSNGYLYWEWPEVYGAEPDTSSVEQEWYSEESFL